VHLVAADIVHVHNKDGRVVLQEVLELFKVFGFLHALMDRGEVYLFSP
jgi:hypothetical protein